MDKKEPKIKKIESPKGKVLAHTLQDLPRPKLSRPFGRQAFKQKEGPITARLERLLGLSQKEKRNVGLRLAQTALSTLNLLIGNDPVHITKKQAKNRLQAPTLSPSTTNWMLKTFLMFIQKAGPEAVITQVAFRTPKRQKREDREDLHPLAGAKRGFDGDKQTVIYSSSDYYNKGHVARLYK